LPRWRGSAMQGARAPVAQLDRDRALPSEGLRI
jgi:hypothetical protein